MDITGTQVRMRTSRRMPLMVAALLIAAVLLGTLGTRLYNAFALLNSGERIDLGGREMFVQCSGAGSPTILLEHGLGSSGLEWQAVQDGLDDTNRVCFTSRAGMGFSDPPAGNRVRSAQDAVDDLLQLLDAADIDGPYVLVGHSFGGYIVRLFADQHANNVIGVVLVDSTHEDQALLLQQQLSPNAWSEIGGAFGTDNPERMDFQASAEQVRETGDLGDLPLVVLQATEQHTEATGRVSRQTAEEIDLVMSELWPQLQLDLAALSTSSAHRPIDGSGHFIQTDNPEAVIAATRSVLAGQ